MDSVSSASCLSLESTRAVLVSVSEYVLEVLVDTESWESLKSTCISKLSIQKQEAFEISEHSVLSNLYWGIIGIEEAIGVECPEERDDKLRDAERMLQVPALLDELGVTAGISNSGLVSSSYFYLSVIRKLQGDDLQVALHFLQAVMVCPALFLVEFRLPAGLCGVLFPSLVVDDEEGEVIGCEGLVRQLARKYKHSLMYYQIMNSGGVPRWNCRSRDASVADVEPRQEANSCRNSLKSVKQGSCIGAGIKHEKVHREIQELYDSNEALRSEDGVSGLRSQNVRPNECLRTKSLKEMLMQNHSGTPTSVSSSYSYRPEEIDLEANMDDTSTSIRLGSTFGQADTYVQKLKAPPSRMDSLCNMIVIPRTRQNLLSNEGIKGDATCFVSGRFFSPIKDLDLSDSELGDLQSNSECGLSTEQNSDQEQRYQHNGQVIDQISPTGQKKRSVRRSTTENTKLLSILETAISKLCFSEGLEDCQEEYVVEVATIYKMLCQRKGVKYAMLRDVIMDQLLAAISTSKEERIIRASVSILATIVSVSKSAVEDVKKKGLRLAHLATALKRNVHEAAVLIHLINPSPLEIKTLELLPALMEVVCASSSSKNKLASLTVTPPAASLMIIEVLVTAFDYTTNSMHLAAISCPHVLFALLDAATRSNLEGSISLANVLVKCMQFDGQCRKHLLQMCSLAPFASLLESNSKRANFTSLEFFHEFLHLPRSSAAILLHRILKEGRTNIMQVLIRCIPKLPPNYQLLAANLLLQLDTLEQSANKSVVRKDAIEIILKSLTTDDNCNTKELAAEILANIGGTYSWTGKPCTVAWLVKKAGLTSLYHRNLIKNIDSLEQTIQDDSWSSKIARIIIDVGEAVFQHLAKGLSSGNRTVARDCLTATAWIGCEIVKHPNRLRSMACEILLPGLEQFLHPGSRLEERLLACLCIYNYASGSGMQKLVHFSEGVRESLRRFSSVTWMAEELHRVAEFYLPNQSRISCVHTQIIEAKHNSSGAVTALTYYKGLICSGYSDGSIKLWDIDQQSAKLVWDVTEHKKVVTCFSILEARECLLSGSADKTIRVWQMIQRKLECIEVIATKEPIRKLETNGELIFLLTENHKMKMIDSLRKVKDISNSRKVRCMSLVQGKLYMGCADSSIQELSLTSNKEREIKAPTKSWRLQNKAITSVVVYKDWLYSGSSVVEGSKLKEWRSNFRPQMPSITQKSGNVLAMEVVEDFIYLNSSLTSNTLQIWLRGTQQNVGRMSAGSRITSLLTANDVVLCGTEKGLIKGWIPL